MVFNQTNINVKYFTLIIPSESMGFTWFHKYNSPFLASEIGSIKTGTKFHFYTISFHFQIYFEISILLLTIWEEIMNFFFRIRDSCTAMYTVLYIIDSIFRFQTVWKIRACFKNLRKIQFSNNILHKKIKIDKQKFIFIHHLDR